MPLFPSTAMAITCFLVLVATIFFWLSAFSTPYIHSIWYIHLRNDDDVKFGTFGWCSAFGCLPHRVGYAWHPEILDNTHLTGSLILVAITAGVGSLAFLSLVHSMYDLVSGAGSFFLVLLTNLLAFVSTLLVLVCWGVAHHRFNKAGLEPRYGAAFVLVILGWLLYLLAIPFALIGWLAIRRDRHIVERRRVWY
ncbi:hypothetical protein Q5752_001404 [Cryptotrichosporon argae]